MSSTMARWVKAVLQWLYRWLLAPRRDLVMYRDNDTLKGFVTFRLGLWRKLRFEFESLPLYVGGEENYGYARVTSFFLVERASYGLRVTDARYVAIDRTFWVAATDPSDREGSLEDAFAKLVSALRAKTPAELREERMAVGSRLEAAPAECQVAVQLLGESRRDRGFSPRADGELHWSCPRTDEKEVAFGVYGSGGDEVHVYLPGTQRTVRFTGDTARELHGLGTVGFEGPL